VRLASSFVGRGAGAVEIGLRISGDVLGSVFTATRSRIKSLGIKDEFFMNMRTANLVESKTWAKSKVSAMR